MTNYRQELIVELMALLKVSVAPMGTGEWFRLVCGVDFEPHGRASETWEVYWKVELPKMERYWRDDQGIWRESGPTTLLKGMQFHDRTLEGVLSKVISFLQELEQQKRAK